MKKPRSVNRYYLVGALPFMTAITCMTVMLVSRGWLKIAAGAAGVGLLLWIIRKFRCLPRWEADYGDMKVCSLVLPVDINADIYLCPVMDRCEFLKYNVEILSSLSRWSQENSKIAVSPRFYEQEGEKFTQITVIREIIRYRQASQIKASLGLVTPAFLLVSLVRGYYVFEWNRICPIASGFPNFLGLLATTLISIASLLTWNKNMSRIDYQVGDELRHYYSKADIAAYIKRRGKLLPPKEPELVNEKSHQLELYYRGQRIGRL